jgi:spore maturation protein CgeB
MSYTFVKISSIYPDYLNNFYHRHPYIYNLNYSDHMATLMSDSFGWADFYTKHLASLEVETCEIITNAEYLQKLWAKEHNTNLSGNELLIHQLKSISPQVLYVDNTYPYDGDFITRIRNEIKSLRQIIGYCGSPYTEEQLNNLRSYDYIITCSPAFLKEFRDKGIKCYLMHNAFEHTLLPKINNNNTHESCDLIFIGGMINGTGFHNTRHSIIKELLLEDIDLHIHSNLKYHSTHVLYIKKMAYFFANLLKKVELEELAKSIPYLRKACSWSELPRDNFQLDLRKDQIFSPLYGLEMFQALSKAKIGFNIHIDAAGLYAGNMRLFETTGVGSCLLTDHKSNISELFDPDYEIITYNSVEECVEKVTWLLEHEEHCKTIANAGQARTLRDHTYQNRALHLDEIIRSNF